MKATIIKKSSRKLALAVLAMLTAMPLSAQSPEGDGHVDKTPKIGGTLRSKYEWQTEEGESRFEVRTARINVSGRLTSVVAYKAEIDLCDEGQIKMLDAYTRLTPWRTLQLTIGQERVPFTIDAHRSPHQQYFANRSFIAKQVGNVRDVGAELGYTWNVGFPIVLNAGVFNGSGLTNQKDFWTRSVNFSAKLQMLMPNVNLVLSAQKVKPDNVSVMMYDAGLTFHRGAFLAEAEYLYKHYDGGAFRPVHAVDVFANYDIALRNKMLRKVSPLVRYDYMSDHSDGKRYDVETAEGSTKQLIVNDHRRSRLTGGFTLSLAKPFTADIRVNYEKYFYGQGVTPKTSERDKFVVEFVTHF